MQYYFYVVLIKENQNYQQNTLNYQYFKLYCNIMLVILIEPYALYKSQPIKTILHYNYDILKYAITISKND